MKSKLFIILFFLSSLEAFSQVSFFKEVFTANEFSKIPQTIKVLDNKIYLASKMSCDNSVDSSNCLTLSQFSELGELESHNILSHSSSANFNNLKIRNDSLFMAGHFSPDGNRQVWSINILTENGDSIFTRFIQMSSKNLNNIFCNGMLLSGSDIFLYGQTSTSAEDFKICRIVKYNLDTEQVEVWDYIAEEGIYFPSWDMEEDQDGNLIIYNERYDVNDIVEVLEILKIDKQGNIVDQVILSGPDNLEVGYNFIKLDNGNYCFVNAVINSIDRPRIQCSDSQGNLIWGFDFPNDFWIPAAGDYSINELHKINNRDIITVGTRRRLLNPGTGTDIFLARFSADGDLLWAKNYNTIEDEETMAYHRYFPTDVDEFDDGSLIIVGTASHHDDIVLLRVGADGFLEGVEGNDDIAVHTEDVSDDLIAVLYPNPTDGHISLDFDKSISGDYKCIDITGALMDQGYLHNQDQLQLDYTHLQAGRYYIILYDGNKYRNFAFVKE